MAKSDCHGDPTCIDRWSYGYCELVSNTHIILSYDAAAGSPNLVPSVPVFVEGTLMSNVPAILAPGDTAVLSFRNGGGQDAVGAEGTFGFEIDGVDAKGIVSFDTKGVLTKADANKLVVRPLGAEKDKLKVSALLERSDCKVVPRGIEVQYVTNIPFLDVDAISKRTTSIDNAYYVPYDWVCRLVLGYTA